MKKIIFIITVISLLISCNKPKNKKYFKSGNLSEIHTFDEKNKKDSSIYYYDSKDLKIKKQIKWLDDSFYVTNYSSTGKKINEGIIGKDSLKIDKWFFYDKDTTRIYEYKNIRGQEYLNQSWIKNSKGDTIRGNYFLLKEIKDTVNVNEFVSFRFYLQGFLFLDNSELTLILPASDENFTRDFSNESNIKTDTIHSLKYDNLNKHLTHLPLNHILISNFEFTSPGEKSVRGILKEQYRSIDDSIKERKIFFEKKIYVKDTID